VIINLCNNCAFAGYCTKLKKKERKKERKKKEGSTVHGAPKLHLKFPKSQTRGDVRV